MKNIYKIIEIPEFRKQMKKLDPPTRRQIAEYIRDVIGQLDNPKSLAKPLVGSLKGLYRFRIGNYRIVCEIIDHQIIIVLVSVGHRRYIYDMIKNKVSH